MHEIWLHSFLMRLCCWRGGEIRPSSLYLAGSGKDSSSPTALWCQPEQEDDLLDVPIPTKWNCSSWSNRLPIQFRGFYLPSKTQLNWYPWLVSRRQKLNHLAFWTMTNARADWHLSFTYRVSSVTTVQVAYPLLPRTIVIPHQICDISLSVYLHAEPKSLSSGFSNSMVLATSFRLLQSSSSRVSCLRTTIQVGIPGDCLFNAPIASPGITYL